MHLGTIIQNAAVIKKTGVVLISLNSFHTPTVEMNGDMLGISGGHHKIKVIGDSSELELLTLFRHSGMEERIEKAVYPVNGKWYLLKEIADFCIPPPETSWLFAVWRRIKCLA